MPNSARPADRRIQRTRAALRSALLELLPERDWEALTVQDVCERANIGRSTFYLHFRNKEELLAGSLDDLRQALQGGGTVAEAGRHPAGLRFLPGLLEHIQQQRRLCRAVFGRRSGHVVQQQFRDMLIRLVRDDLVAEAAGPRADADWQQEAAVRFLAGALVEYLAWWVDARTLRPLDQTLDCLRALCAAVIAGVSPRPR